MVPTDRLAFSFPFFFFCYNDKQSLAHRWMRNQRPDVSAQDGCASCKVLLKKLLRLLSQGALSLISDLLAGVTTCRSTFCTAHFENRRRTWKQRKVRYVSRVPDQTNRHLIFITLNFRPTNGRLCAFIFLDGELHGLRTAGRG